MNTTNESSPPVKISKAVVQLSSQVQQIESISQLAGRFNVHPEKSKGTLDVHIFETEESTRQVEEKLIVSASYTFTAKSKSSAASSDEDRDSVVSIAATFQIVYRLKNKDEVSSKVAEGFARVNARFNLHPYWREYVSATLIRSGLPQYTIPPLNAADRIKELDKSEPEEAAE